MRSNDALYEAIYSSTDEEIVELIRNRSVSERTLLSRHRHIKVVDYFVKLGVVTF